MGVIDVSVLNLSGRYFHFQVKPEQSAADLKSLVASSWKVPYMCLKISVEMRVVEDDEIVASLCESGRELEVSALVVSEKLYDAIENGRLVERAAALTALPQIAQPGDGRAVEAALHALEQPAPILQMSALDTLAVIGKGNKLVINDIATLVCSVCSPHRDTCLKCHALKRLAEIAPKGEERALDALLVGLADTDERVRQQAKEAAPVLVRAGDSMFIARLVEKLRHSDRQVRHAVVETLPIVAGREGVDRAIFECGMLLDANNWLVRQSALKAVASLAKGGGRHSATTMAISCLQDRDRDIRCEALEILSKIASKGDEQAVLIVMACLTDGERDVRETVLRTLPLLAERGSNRVLEAIETYLAHPDADVRHTAVVLMPALSLPGHSGSICALTPLLDDKLARIRCSAIDALVALWEPVDLESHWADDTFEALFSCLMDPERAVRWAAMKALNAMEIACNEDAENLGARCFRTKRCREIQSSFQFEPCLKCAPYLHSMIFLDISGLLVSTLPFLQFELVDLAFSETDSQLLCQVDLSSSVMDRNWNFCTPTLLREMVQQSLWLVDGIYFFDGHTGWNSTLMC